MLEKGLVQIYTGDGKGKTTAAFGLALRAAGHGNKVLIYQFLKPESLDIGERSVLKQNSSDIFVETLDIEWDTSKSLAEPEQVRSAQRAIGEALAKIAQWAQQRLYDVFVLDEIIFCLSNGLAKLKDIKRIIDNRDIGVEIVLTGRGASKELISLADLVTEMKKIKHPFDKGIKARWGIEF
ncbi:MAG: cob(I)yrinic acid a,c-diamide adenosyltransferase [Sedimentisphaerales bacterium]|nr:cob(I)yrinic acid a,c-diamide adenosyltransferase [Sedimentisphaerales bacterium]